MHALEIKNEKDLLLREFVAFLVIPNVRECLSNWNFADSHLKRLVQAKKHSQQKN